MKYQLLQGVLRTLCDQLLPLVLIACYAIGAIARRFGVNELYTAPLASFFVVSPIGAISAPVVVAIIRKSRHLGWAVPFLLPACSAYQHLARAVRAVVFLPAENFQVSYAVVGFVAVLVVDNFVVFQRATQVLFDYDTVFVPAFVFAPYFGRQNYIAMRDGLSIIEQMVIAADAL